MDSQLTNAPVTSALPLPALTALPRLLAALALAALLALTPLGLAQDGTTGGQDADSEARPAADLVYDLYQAGQNLGETGMTITRGKDGTTIDSYVSVGGSFDADATLVTGPDGATQSYFLQGWVQGVPFSIDVTFTDEGAQMALLQGGGQQALSVPSEEPLYVFDNNFLDGYQIAADQVMAEGRGRTFAVLVPQAGISASITFEAPEATTVEYLGESVDAMLLRATYEVGFQPLAISVYLDEAGDILVLEQEPGAVRFERRAEGGQAPSGSATGAEEPAAPRAEAPARTNAVERSLEEASACVEERAVQIGSTGETLHGKLTLPRAAADGSGRPAPTLLLLPGSGSVDVDGNVAPIITNSGYKQLAYELACHGYGVLRAAKLGIPPSTGDGNAVTLGTYASNAGDWMLFLAEQPGVDPDRLGVIGHSEGGLVALYAISEGVIDPAAVVLIAAPGRPMDVLLREQLRASFERSGVTGESLEALEADVDAVLEAVSKVEGVTLPLEGELAGNQIAPLFAHAAGLLRSEIEQDPAALAATVEAPALVIQGLKDVQVRPVDARNLAEALPRPTLLEFPELGHNLNFVAGDPLAGAVPAADEVVSPTLVQALATWLHGWLRAAH